MIIFLQYLSCILITIGMKRTVLLISASQRTAEWPWLLGRLGD